MRRALACALLLAGCAGQPHPLTPSEVAMCRLELVAGLDLPPDTLFEALKGDPQPLSAYLLKTLTPADVVDLINAWKACDPP